MVRDSSVPPGDADTHGRSVGYWCSQEHYGMSELLDFAVEAEKGGFRTAMVSDHFHPWFHTGGHGNFTWVWMAAAAERTREMQFVTGVTCPIYRYPPAIVAQAFASLDDLYPGRIGLGIGTGEAMNEVPAGFEWGTQRERLERTVEAVEIIRELWDSRSGPVTYRGKHYRTERAFLYTPPATRIPLYMAATGPKSTEVAATYCDGLITLVDDSFGDRVARFRKLAEEKGRDASGLEVVVEYKVSYSSDYEKALDSTRIWRSTLLRDVLTSEIYDPRELEERASREVTDDQLKRSWDIITSVDESIGRIERLFDLGATRVYVHSSSPDEMEFLTAFCGRALPYLTERDRRG